MQGAFTAVRPQQQLAWRRNVANTQQLRAAVVQPTQTSSISRATPLVVESRVRIRFTRMGRKKLPFYRIVAVDSRVRRDGRPLEYLGWYDPLKKEANLNAPAIKKWLTVGAEPSDTVAALLKRAMVIEA